MDGRHFAQPPSRQWFADFLCEFSDIKFARGYYLDHIRAEYFTEANVNKFFEYVAKLYEDCNITSASQILNCDETDITGTKVCTLSLCPPTVCLLYALCTYMHA